MIYIPGKCFMYHLIKAMVAGFLGLKLMKKSTAIRFPGRLLYGHFVV